MTPEVDFPARRHPQLSVRHAHVPVGLRPGQSLIGTVRAVLPDGVDLCDRGDDEDGGRVSGAVTVTYTDGTTSQATVAFPDWTLNGGASKPLPVTRRATGSSPATN
ncbi:hypothetical protein ACFWP5_34850 [Streptomyces sp. NPDC058469]|uniref:hypothetical protein n=1 Tax=Streptomyces sp. NPDC058469 TaxID=3346514 RepID=UPI003653C1C0